MGTIRIKADLGHIKEGMDYVTKELLKLKISKEERIQSILATEEILAAVIRHTDETDEVSISVNRLLGSTDIRIAAVGSQIEDSEIIHNLFDETEIDSESLTIVQKFIDSVGTRINYKRTRSLNVCTIKVEVSRLRSLYLTLLALVLGIVFGIILKNLSLDFAKIVSDNILVPIYTMFLNALKLIVAPLVFFSIADSIAGFSDIRALGRIAMKVFVLYIFTSLIAIFVGFGISQIIPIGDSSMQSIITDAATSTITAGSEISVSIKDTIVGIIPSDIINPFLKADMLQIIFVAIMLGIATAMTDNEGAFANFIKSANKVFSKFTAMVIGFMPLAVFCSMAKMMIGMELKDLMKVIMWVPSCYAGHLTMMVVYGLLLALLIRYNPFKFFRLFMPAILTGFSTASSNATLPMSMKQCGEALKISPKIYSFSIPMGATLNMDGNCITLVITAMFGARIFGIDITPSMMFAMVIAIMSLSMGAPGVPGGNLVCAAILMPIIGVPAETISLIMGLYSLVGMSQVAANITGDAVVTTIVAKSENLIEEDNT